MKEIITEAATLEEAKEKAAAELGVAMDALTFEVLQEPRKKALGLFGGSVAKVKATVKESPITAAAAYLKEVLTAMGCADVTVNTEVKDNIGTLTLEGEDLGFIIGRRGETLDALQYLTSLVANRVGSAYHRVVIDIGDYRAKREKALVGLARKLGGQVARTGRRHSLEPMNPYERRIIHTAIQEMEGVTSWSMGSEPNRHVIIGPSDDNPAKDNPKGGKSRHRNRGRKNDGGNGSKEARSERRSDRPQRDRDYVVERPERPVRQFVPRSNPLPVADGATPPSRTESEKESTASLYGRIDL